MCVDEREERGDEGGRSVCFTRRGDRLQTSDTCIMQRHLIMRFNMENSPSMLPNQRSSGYCDIVDLSTFDVEKTTTTKK